MDVRFTGGTLDEAVNQGVRDGYIEGFLRKSIIKDPITNPVNTKDNTPAIIHMELVPGDRVKITIMPKGAAAKT